MAVRPIARRGAAVGVAVFALLAVVAPGQAPRPTTFAGQVAALSEPGGYFDTDNLISNERAYLRALPAIEGAGVHGGAYIGVGPDQNFSYIAHLQPSIAFVLDIRRDNLLLHLLFKALFRLSDTRVSYLARLLGRRAPDEPAAWRDASIARLAAFLEAAKRLDQTEVAALRGQVDEAIRAFGLPLSPADWRTIDRFHRTFMSEGLALKFRSAGRPPRPSYPAYRDLLLADDGRGEQRNYLGSEDTFAVVRTLENRDLVIPVVGDLAGPDALAAIGRLLDERGERLTVFYTSNVEFYLLGDGRFPRFVENLRVVPHAPNAVIVRSIFGYGAAGGGYDRMQTQPVAGLLEGFAAGRFRRYADLISGR